MKSQRKGETVSKRGRNREKRVGGRKRDGGVGEEKRQRVERVGGG